jgi:hypothetical protein
MEANTLIRAPLLRALLPVLPMLLFPTIGYTGTPDTNFPAELMAPPRVQLRKVEPWLRFRRDVVRPRVVGEPSKHK